jgi:hypothetical protein
VRAETTKACPQYERGQKKFRRMCGIAHRKSYERSEARPRRACLLVTDTMQGNVFEAETINLKRPLPGAGWP